jgi:hypothetical protein
MHIKLTYIAVLLGSLVSHSVAQTADEIIIAASGTSNVALLELYSSESCSSCPPADQWISTFVSHKDLWSRFVPVVFHVDYWNHLDWKDELSSSDMTARQVAISKTWTQPAVYTPAVILGGVEWRGWRESKLERLLVSDNSRLALEIVQDPAGLFRVRVSGQTPGVRYIVHIAKLGMGMSSRITDGENSGKILSHSFVVLDWQNQNLETASITPVKFSTDKHRLEKYAVIAWIEEVGRPIALQATGAFL